MLQSGIRGVRQALSFVYNARGDVVQRTDSDGNTVKFEYDAVRRLVYKIFPDGSDARFSYDANGNLTAATNANTSLAFRYDDLNRVTRSPTRGSGRPFSTRTIAMACGQRLPIPKAV